MDLINFGNSIIESYNWLGRRFLIKRDDFLSKEINGNKAYKFYFLLNKNFKNIVSYGGNQSNAMLTLSFIAKNKNANFIYFTKEMPNTLKNNIDGNLKIALQNGMELKFTNNLKEDALKFANEIDATFIPQGGKMIEAKEGIIKLGEDILKLKLKNYCVFYSSGTGISSLFLQEYLKKVNIDVFTTPCIGSEKYLNTQFREFILDVDSYPKIILSNQKIAFGVPKKEILEIYQEWLNMGVEFDLLYDCILLNAIKHNLEIFQKYDNLLFLHSGGIGGNSTQIKRYKFKNLHLK